MFGSTNPFGQSSSSPFGSQSVFGQTSNASNNPFAPKPFGSTSPFGSQTTASIFGSTSTGVFGGSSSLATTPTFGASSSPAFGSSAPAFGASSTPTFGAGSSSFGGSSVFGQKPAFGGFGSTPTQSSPFGSTVQQTQSAFGSSLFGSSTPAFGATSTPAFGATSTPAFGAPSTSAFGATSTPAFGSTSTPAFGSVTTPSFGSTGSAFGASTGSAFGSGGAFGASSTPAFGTSTTPAFGGSTAFGSSSTPVFGSPSNTPFGAASAPSFNFASTPTFGQSNSTFGSSQFGATPTAFGAQSSPFGSQSTTPAFGNSAFGQTSFGGQRGGSRVAAYTPTAEQDGGGQAGKLESISAMPIYKEKSHEELRWEDYQLGDKGGPNPTGQSAGGTGFGTPAAQSNPFGSSPTFGQAAANPFTPTPAVNPFTSKAPFGSSGFGTPTTPAFGTPSTTNLFSTNPSPTPSIFAPSSAPSFGSNTSSSPFGQSSGFGSTPSIFGAASAPGTTATFGSTPNFGNTQSAGLFQSTTPSLGQTNPTFGQTSSLFGQSTTPSFGPSIFGAQSTGFGGFSSNSTPSLLTSNNQGGFGQTTPTLSPPFQPTQTPQVSGGLFNNFGQTQAASSGFGGTTSLFGQGNFGQSPAPQGITAVQPTPVSNPFGTLPAMPQMSIGRSGSSPSVQYGISSMPVTEKPAPVRVSSLLTSRHLSQRRTRLPARKYHPKNDGPKVPFYSNDDEAPSTPKADALYIPRENPRALVIHPIEKWPSRTNAEKLTLLKDTFTPVHENGKISGEGSAPTSNGHMDHNKNRTPVENDSVKEQTNQKANGSREDHHPQKGDSYMTLTGHRAGEAAIVYEHGADIEALMPKLRRADYYTEPRIQELAAKERAEPGFCHHVKDFVVGRQGYGSIKFIGETDVRRLDLESLVQFNNREVIVYLDDSKKPPVGQGLNKPAEVTLLNIKCFDKKTGEQYTAGPRVEKYKEMLKKKARDQGAEFVSYEPVRGEWKFRVNHFSRYSFCDDEDEVDLVVQIL